MIRSGYSPGELLQILNDFYNFQSVFDPEVAPGATLTFETTISEWRSICDLVEPEKLAKYYHDLFQLNTPLGDLAILLSQNKNKLGVFCNYLSEHAVKQSIVPIMVMGQKCRTAALFKALTNNLNIRGVDTKNIRPGSEIAPLFQQHGSVLIEEVNKLVPGALSTFEYRDNLVVRTSLVLCLFSVLSLIVVPIVWHFHWALFIPLCIGIAIGAVGNRLRPAKENIGGYHTVRDLILGMEAQAIKWSE